MSTNDKTKTMQEEEKKITIRYDYLFHCIKYAEQRENFYSSKFVDLEIQIASIVVGILGATSLWNREGIMSVKWFVVFGAISLITSLIFGIISIHVLQTFWNRVLKSQRIRFDILQNFRLSDTSGDYSQAVKDSVAVKLSSSSVIDSPKWPTIFQTLSLSLGLLISVGAAIYTLLK